MLVRSAKLFRPAANLHLQSLLSGVIPGLAVCALVALSAVVLRQVTGLTVISPMIGAIMIGIVVGNVVKIGDWARPGISFATRFLLRTGIVLLGFQITVAQVLSLGVTSLVAVALTLAATFTAILVVGRLLNVPRPLTELIAAGTSVCGASAIMAANSVVKADEEDVAYALATVTIFGTLSMLIFPLLQPMLGLDGETFGLWAGATIHEVGQVTAAAFQAGESAGLTGTLAKLFRVALLVGVLATLSMRARTTSRKNLVATFPVYVLAFLGVIAVNSAVSVPEAMHDIFATVSVAFLSVALAAMGLKAEMRSILRRGPRPMLLGLFGWLFISVAGLALVLTVAVPG
ncbi:MAG: YeiH family protein [Pseudomonadota bacterium]|nr:YeiH family protein [Pseudomonadota bacterium]